MRITLPDLLDRYAILCVKALHTDEVKEEEQAFFLEYTRRMKELPDTELGLYLVSLIDVHKKIWSFESDLRNGQVGQYPTEGLRELPKEELIQLAAVGRAAIQIRNTNLERKRILAKLVEETGDGWKDIKVNHASAEIPEPS